MHFPVPSRMLSTHSPEPLDPQRLSSPDLFASQAALV